MTCRWAAKPARAGHPAQGDPKKTSTAKSPHSLWGTAQHLLLGFCRQKKAGCVVCTCNLILPEKHEVNLSTLQALVGQQHSKPLQLPYGEIKTDIVSQDTRKISLSRDWNLLYSLEINALFNLGTNSYMSAIRNSAIKERSNITHKSEVTNSSPKGINHQEATSILQSYCFSDTSCTF